MPETLANTLLSRSLRGLRDLWRDLVPASWPGAQRDLRPDLPAADLPFVRQQMTACLEARGGEVSARARAAGLGRIYLRLDAEGRARFLRLLAEEHAVDAAALDEAIEAYRSAAPERRAEAEDRLRQILTAPRVRLLTQFNELPQGAKFLVDLRADLLALSERSPALEALDRDLVRLLASWFDVGFLTLERISWHSPAVLLEKLIDYEAVHEIESWNDLRNRLDADRRCYAFFHPRMPGEPLIFVEVALAQGLAGNIQALLDQSAPVQEAREADTAIFYSISNTQKGLRGISFGGFLIKRVVDDLLRDLPHLKRFATLSPIPGFRRWLDGRIAGGEGEILGRRDIERLQHAMSGLETEGGSDARILARALDVADWPRRAELAQALEEPLMRACARYLIEEKRAQRPLDPVARFHLGNGARIERIHWLGDVSSKGIAQSAGMMVNYGYRLSEIEKNHEAFVGAGRIAAAAEVRKLLKS